MGMELLEVAAACGDCRQAGSGMACYVQAIRS